MLTALQTQKLTRLFSLYDTNRDGVIERADYELVAHSTALSGASGASQSLWRCQLENRRRASAFRKGSVPNRYVREALTPS